MLALLSPDANTGGDSSVSPDDNGQVPSPEQPTQEEATATEETPPAEEKAAPSDAPTEEPGTEGGPETKEEEDKAPEKPVLVDRKEDEQLPFHKHERFQELVAEKNQARQELEQLRPQAQRITALDSFMQQNGIQPAQLQRALEYLRYVNSDPEKAASLIEQDYQQLAAATGRILPADLQEKVAAGVLDPEIAKEVARGRGQKSFQERQGQWTNEFQSMQLVQAVDGTINQWAQMKAQTDPDLKPGTVKWKNLDRAIKVERASNPAMTAQQAIVITEKLYKEVSEELASLAPRKPVTKQKPREAASVASASATIKSAEDVTRAIIRGQRPHQMRYS